MLQGTGSSVGKSTLVAGIARLMARRGLRVLPFKPQNMSNNAAVAIGGEIGRAQAFQALACGVEPHVDMNPVLLKPQSETGAQLIVQGRRCETIGARDYQTRKRTLLPAVMESFERLRAKCDIVLVEGAGSASEVNLRAHDIANMGFAEAADLNVVLVGDIDRGGVIASLIGTQSALAPADAARIRAFIVNKMRGDASLFADGMTFVADRTGWHPAGLVGHCAQTQFFPAEDMADLRASVSGQGLHIVVPHLPTLANFDDLDPLKADPGVRLQIVPRGQALPSCDVIVLAGAKSTRADLAALRLEGWDIDIAGHVRRGGRVLGLCGGYQMLGRTIADPAGIEGAPGISEGLGLLDCETMLTPEKRLARVQGHLEGGVCVSGYEIHLGHTTGPACLRPFAILEDGRADGAVSGDGRIMGTYLHGVFERAQARQALLGVTTDYDHQAHVLSGLDAWADHVAECIDIDALMRLAR